MLPTTVDIAFIYVHFIHLSGNNLKKGILFLGSKVGLIFPKGVYVLHLEKKEIALFLFRKCSFFLCLGNP